jgi:hypothetical protein
MVNWNAIWKYSELYLNCQIPNPLFLKSTVFTSFSLQPSELNDVFNFVKETFLFEFLTGNTRSRHYSGLYGILTRIIPSSSQFPSRYFPRDVPTTIINSFLITPIPNTWPALGSLRHFNVLCKSEISRYMIFQTARSLNSLSVQIV